ncbi:SLC13 family permease [Membranicola marinus]|uniref:SLC13 family permease n=1 Tax=Membranihabitans marinus TaxID=1227546 RepID=A0A953HM83_9BACT|nr:SLC13 family permease [Membranihabitans marinus]MBY5957664.1 SLC13 family permease [Membranihabitans marinus]
MSFEIILVFGLLALAFFLFTTEYISFDISALIILVLLMSTGVLDLKEGLAGFSHPATLTVTFMFILSEGIRSTGVLGVVGDYFTRKIQKNFWSGLFQMLLFVSFASAFINNTAVVVIFIPIVIGIASKINVSPSKLLMPLSFAGILGGICTLIGTSTNILVSSIVQDQGMERLSMFEFSPMGVILWGVGLIYMITVGIQWIPSRRKNEELTSGYNIQNYLTDVIIEPGSNLINEVFDQEILTNRLDLDVLRIFKDDIDSSAQRTKVLIEPGDILRIRGSANEIKKLINRDDISLKPSNKWRDYDLKRGRDTLVEAVVAPDSPLVGRSLSNINFTDRSKAIPLAIRHDGETERENLQNINLNAGDVILLIMSREQLAEVDADPSFVVVSEVGISPNRKNKTWIVLLTLLGVVITAALNIFPIVVSAIIGVIVLILTNSVTAEEAFNSVNWKVIVLLAGVIPLGTAMDKSGAAQFIAEKVVFILDDFGPRAVLSGLFLLTMGITALMSNNASAALLIPIALKTAEHLHVNPYPFIFAVTYAASLSFITPFGYQTNTLIYGIGKYKFTDFTKIGAPLNIIFWILATLLIPLFWPF